MFDKISLEKLKEDESKVVFEKDKSYLLAYPEFLQYFKDIDVITRHHLVIGIHFTYGWMPTIFNFRKDETEFDNVVAILNKVKQGSWLTAEELDLLRTCFNNSLVGVSKLLHFINPENYAIWDSRVYRYIKGKDAWQHQIHDYDTYLAYLQFCKGIISQPAFQPLHQSMMNKVGYEITALRSLELIMFKNGTASRADNIIDSNA
jgi:hypothetical protein